VAGKTVNWTVGLRGVVARRNVLAVNPVGAARRTKGADPRVALGPVRLNQLSAPPSSQRDPSPVRFEAR